MIACLIKICFCIIMTAFMNNGPQSGRRKITITNFRKSNQIPCHANKAKDLQRMKLLSTGSKLATHY